MPPHSPHMRQPPVQVTQLFSGYVVAALQQYASSPGEHWRAKDSAIYLVVALAVQGRTAAQGASATNELVNIQDFFDQAIRAARVFLCTQRAWQTCSLGHGGTGVCSRPGAHVQPTRAQQGCQAYAAHSGLPWAALYASV